MTIILVGLNHRTAPLALREKLALSEMTLQNAFADLRGQSLIQEAVILSTCNRLEIYASAENAADGILFIEQYLATLPHIAGTDLTAQVYCYAGDEAIQHLMRVACGLDSMILGETQILGQVTQAFEAARLAAMTGAVLSHLFAGAIHTGKRARTETPVSRYTTSVSHAGALLLLEKLNQQQNARILLIGAGEMAVLAAQALKRLDVSDMEFINRTYSKAETLANDFGGKALTWFQLEEALITADAVICATGAPHLILYRHDVEAVLQKRHGRPLVMLDIAVPRDIEAGVRDLSGVQYFDIDDLQLVVDAHFDLRKEAVPQVEVIIQQEMTKFSEWYRGRQVTPVIKNLREWAQNIADDELLQTLNRLADADERTRQIVSLMAHRLVNRLLHEPTSRLRLQATEGNGAGYAHAVRELFALNDLEAFECQHDAPGGIVSGEPDRSRPCNLHCIMPCTAGQQA